MRGEVVKKFVPPTMPKIASEDASTRTNRKASLFSFFKSKDSPADKKKTDKSRPPNSRRCRLGDQVECDYGEGKIVALRADGFLEVDCSSFTASIYIKEKDVTILEKTSAVSSSTNTEENKKEGDSGAATTEVGGIVDLYGIGADILTPFGKGTVIEIRERRYDEKASVAFIKLQLAWGGTLSTTEERAADWVKENKDESGGGILGVFGRVLRSMTTMTTNTTAKAAVKQELSEQYFDIGAVVQVASFGKATVEEFRADENFYKVRMDFGVGFFHRDSLHPFIVEGCEEGCSVLTKFGNLTGRLTVVNAKSGIHVVEVQGAGGSMKMYLQPDMIVKRIKAAVGDGVVSPYGEGEVLKYRAGAREEERFIVELGSWGILFCGSEGIDRMETGRDIGGLGGGLAGWLSSLWFRNNTREGGGGGGGTDGKGSSVTRSVDGGGTGVGIGRRSRSGSLAL